MYYDNGVAHLLWKSYENIGVPADQSSIT